MPTIGLIREDKIPADNRVALTPAQCKWLLKNVSGLKIIVQPCHIRCFTNNEYERAGVLLSNNLQTCDFLFGIKEVPPSFLIDGKTYLFFSHTKKKQSHNQKLLQTVLEKSITLIDYECLEFEDGQRIIGFGFFAGVVGAHNGIMAYGNRTGLFELGRVFKHKSFAELIHAYFGLHIPNIKIAITGSGRVAHGVLEIMNLMGLHEVDPEEYLNRQFAYPVYTQLKGNDLYLHKKNEKYSRINFHKHPEQFENAFLPYASQTDILMNGIYWDEKVPRLFNKEDIQKKDFSIQTIADITDDEYGSIPINLGDQNIDDPVYGVDKTTFKKTKPYLPNSIDIMAVGNLPNELPRDASRYFGEQLIKFILIDLFKGGNEIIKKATIAEKGKLGDAFQYLQQYADGLN